MIRNTILIACLLASTVFSCCYFLIRQTFECDFFPEAELRSLGYGAATTDEVKKLLAQRLQIDNLIDYYGDGSSFTWQDQQTTGYNYDFGFVNGLLVETSVNVARLPPTGADLLNCLGAPEYYTVEIQYRHEKMLALTLWYVSKGIIAISYQPAPRWINGDIPFQFLHVKRASDLEALTTTFYSIIKLDAETRQKFATEQIAKFKSWPGSWDQIEIP